MALRLKMSPNEPATTRGTPEYLMAVAACSRDEPVPKLNPETRRTPGRVDEDVEVEVDCRRSATVFAKVGS
jgi:hypothetical protein